MPDLNERFMREALTLAQAGVGLVSPNPAVGAVLVKNGSIVGRGIHTYEGLKHAEILAIEDAGADNARHATLYLNLEPCSHFGRTPPCADAIIAAGIAKVVCAMEDPNPAVAGQGFVRLRAAGIHVETGLFAEEAMRLNEAFAKWIRTGLPFVTLKAGMSLDAKIAPSPEDLQAGERWTTSAASRQHAQGLRHAADAILVGIGTVLADDPLLTDRTGLPRRRPLLRIVLDRKLRTPMNSKLVASANARANANQDLLIVTGAEGDRNRAGELLNAHVALLPLLRIIDEQEFWAKLLEILADMQITSLLIEGGAQVFASALRACVVDKLALYVAPRLLGSDGLPAFGGDGIPWIQLKQMRVQRIGEDTLFTGYPVYPYTEL